jgi:hypothetical protein
LGADALVADQSRTAFGDRQALGCDTAGFTFRGAGDERNAEVRAADVTDEPAAAEVAHVIAGVAFVATRPGIGPVAARKDGGNASGEHSKDSAARHAIRYQTR